MPYAVGLDALQLRQFQGMEFDFIGSEVNLKNGYGFTLEAGSTLDASLGDFLIPQAAPDTDGQIGMVDDTLQYFGSVGLHTVPQNLDDLEDVDAAAPDDGDVLTWVDANNAWEPVAPAAIVQSLQAAYEGGNAITVSVAEGGSVIIDGTPDEANTLLTLTGGVHTGGTGENLLSLVTDDQATGYALDINNIGSGDALNVEDNGTPNLNVNGAGAVSVTPSSGQNLTLTAAGAGTVDINAGAGGVDVDTTGPVTIDGTGVSIDGTAASNFTVTGASEDLTLSSAGGSVIVEATEGAVDAIWLNASDSAGGIKGTAGTSGVAIDTTGPLSLGAAAASDITTLDGAITVDGATGVIIQGNTSEVDITTSGAVDVNGAAVTVDGSAGVSIDGSGAASNFSSTGQDLTISTITSGELDLTAAGLMDINAGANLDIDITGTLDILASSTLSIDATGNSNVTATSGDLTLSTETSGDLIADAAANVSLGETNATAVNIAHEGCPTTVNDELFVTGPAEFDDTVGIDGDMRVGAAGASKVTIDSATGDTYISGNLTVDGEAVGVIWGEVNIGDSHIYLNSGDTTVAAGTGGTAVNYLPTATTDTVAAGGFTAGVAGVSNPTVATTGAATFAVGDIVQITGAANEGNNGLREVLSHAANVLTTRGIGNTACQEDFTQNQFTTDATAQGTITKVNVSVIQAGTDGEWEVGKGSSSPAGTPITFTDLAVAGGVDFQDVYDADGAVELSNASGDMTIKATAAGGGADFALFDADGDFLRTDSTNSDITIGSAANAVDIAGATDFSSAGSVTATGNPTWNFGTGQVDFGGNVDANAGLDVSGGNFTLDANDIVVNTNKFTVDGATGDVETAGTIDSVGATTLAIGDTNATKVEIADAGVVTEIQGELTVQGSIDTSAAGALDLGAATATSVNIADTGVQTNIQGTLLVDEQADFTANVDANNGLDVTGANLTVTGVDAVFGDNDGVVFGAGSDATMASDGTDLVTTLGAVSDFVIKTGEAAGATDGIRIIDSADAEQFAVDSDGNVTAATSYGFTGALAIGDTRVVKGGTQIYVENSSGGAITIGQLLMQNEDGAYKVDGSPDLTDAVNTPSFVAAENIGDGNKGWVWMPGSIVTVQTQEAVTAGEIGLSYTNGKAVPESTALILAAMKIVYLGRFLAAAAAGTALMLFNPSFSMIMN